MNQSFPFYSLTGSEQDGDPDALATLARNSSAASPTKPGKLFQSSPRVNSLTGIQILSTGSSVPGNIVTNADLESRFGFEPGWIEQRSGILERRHAPVGTATSDLAVDAANRAIDSANISRDQIDLVVVGTFTPDYNCPSTACLVQNKLGLDAAAFDVQAACSGFMYALATAAQFVATGNSELALVIGADVNSRIVDPTDQGTAPLFGDGAGAVLVTRGNSQQGLTCYQLGADGGGGSLLYCPSGGAVSPAAPQAIAAGNHFLKMDGRKVFKWAIQAVVETMKLMFEQTNVGASDVSLYLLHQANIRIINAAMEQLEIPMERVVNNLHRYGNTSAASIPLALDEVWRAGQVQRGDLLLMSGFGAGLTWGTGLFRW